MYIVRKTWHTMVNFGTLYIGNTFINDKGNPSVKVCLVCKRATKDNDSKVYNYYDFETGDFGYAADDDIVIGATFTLTEDAR